MSALAPSLRGPRRAPRTVPLLPARAARLLAFAALAAFGALHWAMLVAPRESGQLLAAAAIALLSGLAMGACLRLPRPARHAAGAVLALGSVAAALVVAGIPARLLLPGGWGELGAGVTQGVESLADIRVPYAGVDDWPRLVIVGGGALLVALAAAAAFWPARGPAAIGQGIAVGLLALLYGIPAVDLTMSHQFLRGAAFAALLAGFLWLERVPRSTAAGAAVALAAALGLGLAAAPAIDGRGPWVDYERIAESFAPTASVHFDFSHRYGPIDWPRDGRELIRVKARRSAYWKAENVEEFDGARWRSSLALTSARTPLSDELPPNYSARPEWRDRVEVTVRGLEGRDVVAAGTTLGVVRPPSAAVATASPGTFALEDGLERGDSYAAEVYVPRPSPRALAEAGTEYPQLSSTYYTLDIPATERAQRQGFIDDAEVRFAPFGSGDSPSAVYPTAAGLRFQPAVPLLLNSEYARTWGLSQRLARRSQTPYEYARRVLAYLAEGFAYSETPTRRRVPLEAFLFEDKTGYCQHFSGAMALLLRMGGVPARVAGGFSPGSYSRKRKDWVVRDIDAHSWVEAYFPGYGWITFDPTPSASPARSQLINIGLPALDAPPGAGDAAQRGDVPEAGPRAAGDPGAGSGGGGVGLGLVLLSVLVLGALAAAGVMVARGRRRVREAGISDPLLAELQRALRRCGRAPDGGATLSTLERRLHLDGGAAGYLGALRERRYGFGTRVPTRAQRRDLRRALGRGLGVAGRLRALWALPPKLRSTRSLH